MSVVSCTLSRLGRGGRFFVDAKGGVSGVATVDWDVGALTVLNEKAATTVAAVAGSDDKVCRSTCPRYSHLTVCTIALMVLL